MFMSGSFKKYTDLKNQAPVDKMDSVGKLANDASQLDHFMHEVEVMKEDVKTMEKLHKRLVGKSEEGKTILDAAKMKEMRALLDSDIDHVLRLAKSIKKRIEGLEKFYNNTMDSRISGVGSSIDRTKISVVMNLEKKLRDMMDAFQGLRVQMAAVHKETVENKYFEIAREKQYIETIENLASSGEVEEYLADAIEEHGKDTVLHFIEEVQERREESKNMQRNLVELHQAFLDMAALIETRVQKIGSGENQVARGNSFIKPTGAAQLEDQPMDYDMEAKRRATIALIVAIALVITIIVPFFAVESRKDLE